MQIDKGVLWVAAALSHGSQHSEQSLAGFQPSFAPSGWVILCSEQFAQLCLLSLGGKQLNKMLILRQT